MPKGLTIGIVVYIESDIVNLIIDPSNFFLISLTLFHLYISRRTSSLDGHPSGSNHSNEILQLLGLGKTECLDGRKPLQECEYLVLLIVER